MTDAEYSHMVLMKTYQICNLIIAQNRLPAMTRSTHPVVPTSVMPEPPPPKFMVQPRNFSTQMQECMITNRCPNANVFYLRPYGPQSFSDSQDFLLQTFQIPQHCDEEQHEEPFLFLNNMRSTQEKHDISQSIYWDK
ncbi:hypothetical protein GPJ56_008574 [Histomonas meleagridis]|uniref:uncharacterized protein n=1 Tax=Histomonas meleagridis TaxID=135588 RepID=UPI00355A9D8A|nr:hypothetical protein GPJ56_008574 [Histomonas meleagridis]KAH0798287.1 hypothetical protein GO595_008836 [Histomonas meleagridis]